MDGLAIRFICMSKATTSFIGMLKATSFKGTLKATGFKETLKMTTL